MVTLYFSQIINKYIGLSTDQKPIGKNGDEFFEMDTGKRFKYTSTGHWATGEGATVVGIAIAGVDYAGYK